MGKSTENKNKNFLKEGFIEVSRHHKEYLGTDIPEDYFAKSKLSILNKIKSIDNSFLKESNSEVTQHHKKYLGTDIPEGYFAKSKTSIIDKIKEEAKMASQPKKQTVFYMRSNFRYIAVASLVFILSLTVWLQNSNNISEINHLNIEGLAFQDDVLINSLLVEDSEVDAFADAILFNEVMVKAEISEQKMDDLILNSLMIEDSLLDDYMDDEFVETIIL